VSCRTSRRCRGSRSWLAAAAVSLAIVVGSSIPSAPVRASDDPASVEAKRHYEEGTKAFNLGEYPRAIAEFKATYNAKPDPLLLYNIAQSYRLAGDAGQALFFYKSFLRNMPAAENRKEVEGQIHKLEKQVADQKKDPASAPPPVIVPAPTPAPSPVTPPPAAVAPPAAGSTTATVPTPVPNPPAASAPPDTARPDAPPSVMTAPPPTQGSSPQVDLTTTAPPATSRDDAEDRPFYKKWWFWVGTAGVVILVGGIAAANARKPPSTSLGLYDPTFM
jgi:hypothetical protein